jgi:hypothetical protein
MTRTGRRSGEVQAFTAVVKVPASTETGDAPDWQGAKRENIGNI